VTISHNHYFNANSENAVEINLSWTQLEEKGCSYSIWEPSP